MIMGKRRGAPLGNQNARKHGYYSNVLDDSEKRNLKMASQIKGLDDEINLLRVKIKSIAERDPQNLRLISQATVSLARLLHTRETNFKKDQDLGQAIQKVIREIGIPLGVDKFLKNRDDIKNRS
jgi:hypothetical protein